MSDIPFQSAADSRVSLDFGPDPKWKDMLWVCPGRGGQGRGQGRARRCGGDGHPLGSCDTPDRKAEPLQ